MPDSLMMLRNFVLDEDSEKMKLTEQVIDKWETPNSWQQAKRVLSPTYSRI